MRLPSFWNENNSLIVKLWTRFNMNEYPTLWTVIACDGKLRPYGTYARKQWSNAELAACDIAMKLQYVVYAYAPQTNPTRRS